MSETKIIETELRGLRRRLRPVDYHRDHLVETLERHLGAQYATLLARRDSLPQDRLSWWVAGVERPVPLTTLAPAEQVKLRVRLEEMRAAVTGLADKLQKDGSETDRETADALRKALIVPGDRSIWSLNGQPVLIEWGYEFEDEQERIAALEKQGGPRKRGLAATVAPAVATSAPAKPQLAPILPKVEASRVPWYLLAWLPFILLMTGIFWLLLKSCSISFLPFLDRCDHTITGNLDALDDENRTLRDQIRAAELEGARKQADCTRAPPAPPQPAPKPPEPTEGQDRVKDAGGKTGKLEVTLTWNTTDDLDLHVVCPGGTINHMEQTSCSGGHLDIDRNAGATVSDPVEHVVWAQNPPPGEYKVQVKMYKRNGNGTAPIKFMIEVKDGDETRQFPGAVTRDKQIVDVTSFRK